MKAREVFLIDDDLDDQEIFCSALKEVDDSIVCHLANNGLEAIKKLQQPFFTPDLIFVDLNMPCSDGFEFMETCSHYFPALSTPIIVYTTTDSVEARIKAKRLGAYHFITKPALFTDVVSILRDIVATPNAYEAR
jgi:CheY-like chemotaxis protein